MADASSFYPFYLFSVRCVVLAPNPQVHTTIFVHGEEPLKPGNSRSFLARHVNCYSANLFLSSLVFMCIYQDGLALGKTIKTKLVTLCWKGDEEMETSTKTVRLPVPYQLPAQPYSAEG